MAKKSFQSGDQVRWNTPQGETTGKVEKKVTSRTKVKGHVAKASKEHPEYLVKSSKSGKRAVHRPSELKNAH